MITISVFQCYLLLSRIYFVIFVETICKYRAQISRLLRFFWLRQFIISYVGIYIQTSKSFYRFECHICNLKSLYMRLYTSGHKLNHFSFILQEFNTKSTTYFFKSFFSKHKSWKRLGCRNMGRFLFGWQKSWISNFFAFWISKHQKM